MKPIIELIVSVRAWSWRGLVGLALIAASYALPRFFALPTEAHDVLEHGYLVGHALLVAEAAKARKEPPAPPAQ